MPSPRRVIDPEGGIYHAISRGNNRTAVFHDDDDYREFLGLLDECRRILPCAIHHYTLMTNHVHIELAPSPKTRLAAMMQHINHGYSRYHKQRYGFIGHLWQGRYKSHLINNDAYLLACSIYIELNPVRAGIVAKPEEYRWSSYRFYAFGEDNPLVEPDPVYLALGDKQEDRQTMYRSLTKMWQERPMNKKEARSFFKKGAVP